ncbi:MAG TPA: chromosome segregation protein SMC [Lachnospiraceae bacterium]|nr:chromosome segregation protein SMC [Lachnospiraceae bacterium]
MYLKMIEMQGFKSFAHRMTFEFQEGITGIVGPNGSGKSNVADAVRWVLGEQSAKQLRGGNMQDVIFAGTELRKPQSFASVAITFDNSDHALDIDYHEVTVTRRLYRSGESEYLINNAPVRLKDINELFYDTGIGKEGYSIIGQGQIDRIISGRPEERRELFDEAAGIVKFKRRKAAALKKLDEEQQNLLRVNDILSELGAQIEPLKKQSAIAKIYLEKKEVLKQLDINLFLLDDERVEKQLAEIAEKTAITDADIKETEEKFEKTKAEYEKLENDINAIDSDIAAVRDKAAKNELLRQQLHAQIDLLNEQINTVRQNSEHFKSRRQSIASEIEKRTEEKNSHLKEQDLLDASIKKAADEQKTENEKLRACEQELEKINSDINRSKSSVIAMLNSRASVKGKLQRYDAMLEQIDIRKSEISGRMLRFREEENDASAAISQADEALKTAQSAIAALKEKTGKDEEKVAAYQKQIAESNRTLDAGQTAYHREASKLESLKTLTENYDGYGNGIKKVMEQKGRNPGILGVVADVISVGKKYELAVETALGGSIRNIVTDNENTAKYLIEYLKTNKFGRATFLPLTNIRGRKRYDHEEALREEGVIGLASSLVKVEERFSALNEHLLGRTLVVDNIDHAISIGRKYSHSLYMVTLQGESFSPGGSITGGAFRNQENLLGRRREIEELTQNVKTLKNEMDEMQKSIEEIRAKRNALRDEIVEISGKLQDQLIRQNTAQLSKKQAEEQIRGNHINRSSLEKENAEIEKQISQIRGLKAGIEKELKASEADEQKINAEAGELEKKAEELQKQKDRQSYLLESVHVKYAGLTQQSGFLATNVERLDREIAGLKEEDISVVQGMDSGAGEIKEKLDSISKVELTIKAAEEEVSLNDADEKKLTEEKDRLSESHKSFFAKRDELQERLNKLDKESYRLSSQKDRISEAMEGSISYLWEEYELTPNQAKPLRNPEYTDRAAIRKDISHLKDEIKQLGNVNVNAIEDYKSILERHTFLSAQHEDLVQSAATLQGIIEELDKGMRKQFNEKFAEINREFDKAFKELFGGGKGTLEIENDVDILEAGIAIISQPPGKKLQNMMQLSGGEKSLTAIALLFAIQNLKPSPFCLLDEIEAALDDNNVARFANYLHKLTKNTQFIIITHRRGTMAAADRLYGITMQEKGVSALVSVSLIEDKLQA